MAAANNKDKNFALKLALTSVLFFRRCSPNPSANGDGVNTGPLYILADSIT
jgi:hypothetical protein